MDEANDDCNHLDDDGIDWNEHEFAQSYWGEALFPNHMSQLEIAHLIGWATHQQSPMPLPSHNPLIGLSNDPLPPSVHAYINQAACEILQQQEVTRREQELRHQQLPEAIRVPLHHKPLPWESFDASAIEAVGVVLEDMMTASLLPLATLHVERCRRKEQESNLPAFEDWTLPPEEAISMLMREGNSSCANSNAQLPGLPTASPPVKTLVASNTANTHVYTEQSDDETSRREQAIQTWCDSQQLDRQFVRDNADLFRWFLPPMNDKNENDTGDAAKKCEL
ncbi:hypothetical protein MPSEU_000578100 [Mayamaea pseudoterrestris]|nr:hypothetical protein MPSEU_000578100 [Mayamaea pseudoterrestris]